MIRKNKFFTKLFCALPVVTAIPTLVVSCKKKDEDKNFYDATLINLSDENFVLDSIDLIESGKKFETNIVLKDQTNVSKIENVHIWTQDGWLFNDDYEVTISDDLQSAHVVIYKPVSDVFIIMSTTNSGKIKPWDPECIYTLFSKEVNSIEEELDQGKKCYVPFWYNEEVMPDRKKVSSEIFSIEQDDEEIVSASDFVLGDVAFNEEKQKFYLPISLKPEKQLDKDLNLTLTIKFTYSIGEIVITRYSDINLKIYSKSNTYEPFVFNKITKSGDNITISIRLDYLKLYWTPLHGQVTCTVPEDRQDEYEIAESYCQLDSQGIFSVTLKRKSGTSTKFDIEINYNINADNNQVPIQTFLFTENNPI